MSFESPVVKYDWADEVEREFHSIDNNSTPLNVKTDIPYSPSQKRRNANSVSKSTRNGEQFRGRFQRGGESTNKSRHSRKDARKLVGFEKTGMKAVDSGASSAACVLVVSRSGKTLTKPISTDTNHQAKSSKTNSSSFSTLSRADSSRDWNLDKISTTS